MPNFSGIWTVTQQMQAKGASTWPATPGAPTIGTATAGSGLCASVAFTAPACTGYPATITGYRVVSTPGCLTATGASSPLVVTGLTNATSYTFKAQATNSTGYGALSAASNSITASSAGSQSYTCSGTYSWVAPSGVTAVSVVAVGAGGNGKRTGRGATAGGLGYKNNISVTPGNSYTVVVGAPAANQSGSSYFSAACVVSGGGGIGGCFSGSGSLFVGGTYTGDGGGNGGRPAPNNCLTNFGTGGGGAGGYSGNGGTGGYGGCCNPSGNGTSGSGGAGGGGGGSYNTGCKGGGGGGGVGIFGAGSNGAGGNYPSNGGGGGSGGTAGGSTSTTAGGAGGAYGAGGGGSGPATGGAGGVGAVRIVWPGNTRTFPSTNVGAP